MSHSLTQKKNLKLQQSQEPTKQQQLLDKILSQSENQECADCRAKSPQWASIDFGVIICMNCAGAHRTLSRQITRVRSIKLDNWTFDLIEIIQNIGNQIANDFFECQVPITYRKPTSNSSLEELIKYVNDKYVKRMFTPEDIEDPVKQFKQHGIIQKKQESKLDKNQQESLTEKDSENTRIIKPMSLIVKPEQQKQQQNEKQVVNNIDNQNNLLDNDEFEEFQQAIVAAPIIQQSESDEFASYQIAEHSKMQNKNEINLNQAYQQSYTNNQSGTQFSQKNYDALNMLNNHQFNQQQMIMRQQHQYQQYFLQQHQQASKVYQQSQQNMQHYQKSGYLNNGQHF